MFDIELSIIIPAHNAGKDLGYSIGSVVNQCSYLDKVEILIIENGSTDDTTEVALEWSEKYPCIRVLHSDKGVSNARNMGIESASGNWLMFLDADDAIVEGGMEYLPFDMQKKDTDIFFYGHINGNNIRKVTDDDVDVTYVSEQVEEGLIHMLENPTRYMQVWAKLIKRELVLANKLLFNPDLRLSEDSDFILRCLKLAQKVELKSDVLYAYSVNQASTMRTFDGNKINDYIFAMQESYKAVENESVHLKAAFDKYVLMHMNIAMVRENFSFSNSASIINKHKKMCKIIKEPIFYNAIKSVKVKQCLSPRMAPVLCIKCKIVWGATFIYWIRAFQNYTRER